MVPCSETGTLTGSVKIDLAKGVVWLSVPGMTPRYSQPEENVASVLVRSAQRSHCENPRKAADAFRSQCAFQVRKHC